MSENTQEPVVRYDVAGGVATITLDSPANRNALSPRLLHKLTEALTRAESDDTARCVVLTHTGSTFCAGADLTSPPVPGAERKSPADAVTDLMVAMLAHDKPIVGLVTGHVRAGGMGLVGACDLVVAGPKADFALTEVRLGLAASIVSMTILPRLAGRDAARVFLTGETFDAARAAELSFVSAAATTDDGLVSELKQLTDAFAHCSPQGLRETKRLLNEEILVRIERKRADLGSQSMRLFSSDEAREGIAAFREKRRPAWVLG